MESGRLQLGLGAHALVLEGSGADIRGGSLVFDYNGGSAPAATIQGLLTDSYNGGLWNVGKFRDTTAGGSGLTLGWKDDSASHAVTVMATYAADFNLDGSVDNLDKDVWGAYFGFGTTWQQGDANYDGVVNGLDLDLWYLNVGHESGSSEAAAATAKWTVMVYMDGDNNLEGAGIDDFLEMASAGSNANVNIVVQFDRASGYDTSYGDWTDTRRGIIMPGNVPSLSWGASIGEVNMGDPTTLVNFVDWATSQLPGRPLCVGSLGSWRRLAFDRILYKGACWDDTNGSDYLENREVGTALAAIPQNMDLFGYDCCLMAMLECAHQVRNEASVFVTSEEAEPGDGWAYDAFLPHLKANPSWTAAQLGADIVTTYGNYYGLGSGTTQSATDLSVVGAASPTGLSATVSDLAATIMSNATYSDYNRLADASRRRPVFQRHQLPRSRRFSQQRRRRCRPDGLDSHGGDDCPGRL